MTTKTGPKQERPPVDETRLAYEAHTLAQMLFQQLAVTRGWTATPFTPQVHDPAVFQNLGAPPAPGTWGAWNQPGIWG